MRRKLPECIGFKWIMIQNIAIKTKKNKAINQLNDL